MVLVNPVKEVAVLESGFGGRRPGTRTVHYGRGASFSGRLVSQAGSALPGRAIAVVETFGEGSRLARRIAMTRTAADGSFLARLPPGPTRQVQAMFDGDRVLTRASGRRVRLAVRTSVRLRASAATAVVGGAPILFSGRIAHLGAAIPAGLPVQLQYRLAGSEWRTFRTVQTDPIGSFRYPYSFSDDDSRGIRFQFRAFVAAQPGWPYEAAASRPILVTGR
jgi:hypothetical protein